MHSRKLYLLVMTVFAVLALCGLAELPQWYLDTGLPVTDTDGDGIPDIWEIRTFGNASVADSGLDRDGDGLTDLEEFLFGSDPRTFSTMGDGWSDKDKRDAGLTAVDRIVPGVSYEQWLGWLGWDTQTWQSLTATNEEGFAVAYSSFVYNNLPYSDTNENGTVDFWLATTTDRPAWLTVCDAFSTNSFPVRSGTSRLRIRVAYGADVTVSLDPCPGALAQSSGATNGLWLCKMVVEPDRPNTLVFSEGETPQPAPGDPDGVNGLLALTSSGGAVQPLESGPRSTSLRPIRVTNGIRRLGDGYWCICRSVPPCPWPTYGMIAGDCTGNVTVNGAAVSSVDDPLLAKDDADTVWQASQPCLVCTVTQTVASVTYPFLYERVIFSFSPCMPRPTGAYGAEDHGEAHEPGTDETTCCGGVGGTCKDGPAWYIGFSHDSVRTRNLTRIEVGNDDEDTMEHCLGVVWEPGGKTNLFALLGGAYLPFKDDLNFTAEGLTVNNDGELEFPQKAPPDLKLAICRVTLHYTPNPEFYRVFDRLWVVVNAPETLSAFNGWYAQNADIGWTTNLPKPFASVSFETNWWGTVIPVMTNLTGSCWHPPEAKNSFLHHDARYEMRSKPTAGGHGHQAMYNAKGDIIVNPIASGTADLFAPFDANNNPYWNSNHREQDVYPFIRALQLDGNPVHPNNKLVPTTLNRPCIYKGANTDKYVERRPVLP